MTQENIDSKKPKKQKRQSCIIKAVIVIILLFLLLQYGDSLKLYGPSKFPDRILLSWTDLPEYSQTVTWRTSLIAGNGIAQVRPATGSPNLEEDANQVKASRQILTTRLGPAYYYSATFTDLRPETKYVYRVGDGKHWSEWSHFTTASTEEKPFRFIYLGDVQNDIRSRASRVIRQAAADAPEAAFFLYAGDLINKRNDIEWGEWFIATGNIHRNIACFATPGNHEYKASKQKLCHHWRRIFEFPQNGPENAKETSYYFDYQGVRFISVDSNLPPDTQTSWLKQALHNHGKKWTIVMFHYPVYSASKERDNKAIRVTWQPLFDQYKVDLVLQGHDHAYARSKPAQFQDLPVDQIQASETGTVYVVSVCGPKMYPLSKDKPILERVGSDLQFYQIITIDGDTLEYHAKTANGTLFDAFSLIKSSDRTNRIQNLMPDASEIQLSNPSF